MAEKIGFISFSAFELHRANEFDAIKTKLYDASKPARTFFDIHPSQPPWKNIANMRFEPMHRRIPSELQPLMNDYQRYFVERAIQHEMYLRWWRRHHAWDRETEIYYMRFDDLREYFHDRWNQQSYIQLGRIRSMFRHIREKEWMDRRYDEALVDSRHFEHKHQKIKHLAHKTEQAIMIHHKNVEKPDDKRLLAKATERIHTTGEHMARDQLHPPQPTPPRWAQALAIADYAQRSQPLIPPTHYLNPPEPKKTEAIPPPIATKFGRV